MSGTRITSRSSLKVKGLDPLNPQFHSGQVEAWKYWRAGKRIILVCSGMQGGKSSFGSIWTDAVLNPYRQEKVNFIVATPTYKILHQSTLFALLKAFEPRGWKLHKVDMYLDHPVWKPKILLRTGENPNSCEGVQDVVGIWGDEAGQFTKLFWENLQSRTSFREAPLLLTTTPYAMNWVHKELELPFKKGLREDVGYVEFPSTANPSFPKDEFDRQKKLLDPAAFARRYEGLHAKMQGLVYPDYNETDHICERRDLPKQTVYYGGVDWGYSPDPFAVVIRAVTPQGEHFDVKTFKGTNKTIGQKVMIAQSFSKMWPVKFWICGHDEPGSIQEFNNNGLRAVQCVVSKNSVEERIEKHNELLRTKRYKIFADSADDLDDEYNTYYRNPNTGAPEGDDHLMDATGMISHYLAMFPSDTRRPKLPGGTINMVRNRHGLRVKSAKSGPLDVWEI